MHIPSATAAAGLVFALSHTGSTDAAPPAPETWAKVNSAGTYLHGRLDAKGDKLTLTKEGGEVHKLDPAGLVSIDFDHFRPLDETEPLPDGALRSPWKAGAVGDLARGGKAKVQAGRIVVETSSPDS